MRYATAALVLALSTAAVAQPHGHQHFHKKSAEAKREAEPEPAPLADVDWAAVSYDVDWSAVSYTYSAGQTWGESTAVAAPATPTDAPAAPVVTSAAAAVTTAAAPASTPESSAPAPSAATSAAAPASSSTSSGGLVAAILSSADQTLLSTLGALTGQNSDSNNGAIWVGSDGTYTLELTNEASEDAVIVAWGPAGSWINANQPLITTSVPAGESVMLSFASGVSGALSSIFPDTQLVNGQVFNTWVEFTTGPSGVFDISREVNMSGRSFSVVGPQCTTDMNTCVFMCSGGASSCMYDYELINCDAGSQPGAQNGLDNGAASGGCGGLGDSAALTGSFS